MELRIKATGEIIVKNYHELHHKPEYIVTSDPYMFRKDVINIKLDTLWQRFVDLILPSLFDDKIQYFTMEVYIQLEDHPVDDECDIVFHKREYLSAQFAIKIMSSIKIGLGMLIDEDEETFHQNNELYWQICKRFMHLGINIHPDIVNNLLSMVSRNFDYGHKDWETIKNIAVKWIYINHHVHIIQRAFRNYQQSKKKRYTITRITSRLNTYRDELIAKALHPDRILQTYEPCECWT